MNEIPNKDTTSLCLTVNQPSYWSVLRWIHLHASEEEFALLAHERLPRLDAQPDLPPMEISIRGNRIAAAYFVRLNGSAGTLGGLRFKPGFEAFASDLIQSLHRRQVEIGIRQIQALVDIHDPMQNNVLSRSAFNCATHVKQLCYDLARPWPPSVSLAGLSWIRAGQGSFSAVAELIQATFQGSLDCPALNGLRSAEETTQGFLDGRSWDDVASVDGQPWWLLCHDSRPIGCCLVNQHSSDLCELAYMGLIQSWRGKQLGRILVEKAIESAKLKNARFLMSAVDSMNWPAVGLYQSHGFKTVKELAVWLPKPTVIKLAA
jgi:ribosomal protein S18 acetylase RimI-like enzyme